MLEKEFKYFQDHQDELVQKYEGKFIVLVGSEVVGVFDTEMEAYTAMKMKYKPGTFLIQQCLSGKNGCTQTFHSRVGFG